jgi:hypothetical protein
MTHCELCDSPPYFQHLLAPTNHPIYKAMLINQVLVDSVLRTNYLIIILICLCHLNNIIESYLRHVIRIIFYARLNSD